MALVRTGAYWNWVQHSIVQSTYYKNVNALDKYLAHSILLPDVNNEREGNRTEAYKTALTKLDALVLFRCA